MADNGNSDRKGARRMRGAVLPLDRRLQGMAGRAWQARGEADAMTAGDPLLRSLRNLGDDLLREPVPDRLITALHRRSSWGR
ncbi:MAG: hypothetical protein HC871_04985 [Rhizobiales bacterium]|nr:hypothetical protein [Hyphomicrobiales bacterium]